MITIFFFYGLAFFMMGVMALLVPKRENFLGFADNLWLVGLFGVIHGLNEWIDLFILRGSPFDVPLLSLIGSLLLPGSFLCLVLFGTRILCREKPALYWLKHLWIVCLIVWLAAYHWGRGFLISGIVARYFICIPGTFLSAWVLFFLFFKRRDRTIPNIIPAALGILAVTFAAYGVLAGGIVPKADFLLAGVLNHEVFIRVTGLPVQLFRMICAIVMAVAFSVLVGAYAERNDKIRVRGGIRAKVLWLVLASVFLTGGLVSGLIYGQGKELLRRIIVDERQRSASNLSMVISNFINREIANTESLLTDPVILSEVQKSNAKYILKEASGISRAMEEKDKEWIAASEDSPLVKTYTESHLAEELRRSVQYIQGREEIFLTDKFGALVGASKKVSDFYQADELWWIRAYDHGKGNIFLEGPHYDESAGAMALIFAVPLRDSSGKVEGICKAVSNIKNYITLLRRYDIGKTGHAEVIDLQGHSLFEPKIECKTTPRLESRDVQKILKEKNGWLMSRSGSDTERKVVVWSEVENAMLHHGGERWFVVINQDEREMFSALGGFVYQVAFLSLLLILVMLPFGLLMGGKIVRPIRRLRKFA